MDEQGCSALGGAAKGYHHSAVAVLLSQGAFIDPAYVCHCLSYLSLSVIPVIICHFSVVMSALLSCKAFMGPRRVIYLPLLCHCVCSVFLLSCKPNLCSHFQPWGLRYKHCIDRVYETQDQPVHLSIFPGINDPCCCSVIADNDDVLPLCS